MQKRQTRTFIAVILLLLAAAMLFQRFRNPGFSGPACAFDKRLPVDDLEYVAHARCRMNCREVDEDLVEEVYTEGILNCDKSDPTGQRNGHPRYALEKQDGRRGQVRLIIEENAGQHVVITVIRLGEDDKCDCS